ncbi:hypothetical protein AAVH_13286 [Aphelenchoides avenae]|nr:hypothetical protein AAVH_13286 [Aphelenchus avenae]
MEAPEFFEFSLSALYYCHVDFLGLGGYYMADCINAIISRYAPAISIKHLFCGSLLRSAGPFEQDLAVFYGAFEKFASIEFVTCSSCAPGIENALRDLCTAKQILFAVL